MPASKETIVYIDGFNLYYRCLRGTRYKWLDLARLCQILLPSDHIRAIKYFTAAVKSRPHDQRLLSASGSTCVPFAPFHTLRSSTAIS